MFKRRFLLTVAFFALLVGLFTISCFAAKTTPVKVTVQLSVGDRPINTTVDKLFNYTEDSNGSYTITGFKSNFDGYSSSIIKEVHIPYDAANVNITTSYPSVRSIVIDDNCSATITSLKGFGNASTITVGKKCKISFGEGCAPANVQSLTFTGAESTINVGANAFNGIAKLTELVFTAGNTYNLASHCFSGIGISSLELVDGSTFNFTGTGAFYGCASLKTIYTGDLVESLSNSPFDNCGALEFAYLSKVTSISSNAFRSATSGTNTEKHELKVYIHSSNEVNIAADSFTNRSTYGVVVCALGTNVTSFSSCKYELHQGIQHKYTPASDKVSCYMGYVTDCPCGKVANAYYRLYKSGESMQIVELKNGINPDVPHTFTAAETISYPNGYESTGVIEPKCSVCGTLEGTVRTTPALVQFLGYSLAEGGNVKAMVVGIRFNSIAIDQYEMATGDEMGFGIALASKNAIGGNNPIKDDGTAYSGSVYQFDMNKMGMYDATVKLMGISVNTIATDFYMTGYIKTSKGVVYIQGNGNADTPETISYAELIRQNS